jgi:hypothetical protein
MWQKISDAVGPTARDALWQHPDVVPTAEDITDPTALLARLTSGKIQLDDVDQAIEDLLNDDTTERPVED